MANNLPPWEVNNAPQNNNTNSSAPPWEQGQVSQNVSVPAASSEPTFEGEHSNNGNMAALAGILALGAFIASKGKDSETLAPYLEKIIPGMAKDISIAPKVIGQISGKEGQKVLTGGLEATPSAKILQNQHVDANPLNLEFKPDVKQFGKDIRYEHQGDMNANALRASNVGSEISKLPEEQNIGLYLKRDVVNNNDPEIAKQKLQWLAQQNPKLESAVNHALNPTEEMLQAENLASSYYEATGKAGQQYSYLPHLLDNDSYSNRIYLKPPKNSAKTEIYKSKLSKTTGHSKERVFNDITEAMGFGKDESFIPMKPATLKQSDLIHIHGEEHSKVLSNNKLYQKLEEMGVGFQAKDGKIPAGYSRLGNGNFVVPSELASELKAISESKTINFGIFKKVNGVLKANLLAGDFGFHFLNVGVKNFTAGGLSVGDFFKYGSNPELKLAFVRSGGMTHTSDISREIIAELNNDKKPLIQLLSFFANNPWTKASNDLLFGKIIPDGMTAGWSKDMLNWTVKHPEATESEIREAARSLADHWNNLGGFSNLTAKGMTQNQQEVGQMMFLALKWNASKVNHFMQLFEKTPGGDAARITAMRGVAGSLIVGNVLNNLFTGHNMWENPKGKEFSIQWGKSSRVYTPVLNAPYEDAIKLVEKTAEKGPIGGPVQFVEGKGSPVYKIAKTSSAIAQNTNYFGKPIYNHSDSYLDKSLKSLTYGVGQNLAIPISLQSLIKLHQKNDRNPVDYILAGSTFGQVGKTQEEQDRSEFWQRYRDLKEKRKQLYKR